MDMHNFSHLKNQAIKELHEMNKKAAQKQYCIQDSTQNKSKNLLNNFGIDFSGDELLIIALVLILHQDCCDKWLFLALLYILM